MPELCYINSVHHWKLRMMRIGEAVVDAAVYFTPYLPPNEVNVYTIVTIVCVIVALAQYGFHSAHA
jgi:hypothetical protein